MAKSKDKLFLEELVSEVREDFLSRQKEKFSLERQWELNMDFLYGNQYAKINIDGEISDEEKDFFWQSRKVYNHIAPIIEARVSRLGRVRPTMSVRASGDEESDIKTAKIVSNVLNSTCARLDLDNLIKKATDWSEVTGSSFYKVVWNNNLGKKLGEVNGHSVYEGDVDIEVVSPFEIYPDSLFSQDVSDCKSIIHARAMHVEDIYQIYGVEVEGENLQNLLTYKSRNGFSTTKKSYSDYALVIERYEKPSRAYPNGRVVSVAGNNLLYVGELPYINEKDCKRDFPFVRQVCLPQTGCFFGISIVERIIPIQRAFNAVKNRKHELLNRISMGVITVEDGAVDVEELADDGLYPGKVIVYRQGSNPPSIMNAGNFPNDFSYEEEMLKNEFTTISGVSEFTRYGDSKVNMASGVALQLLIEQDDTRLYSSIDNIKRTIKTLAKHIIRLYKQFAVKTRIMKIAGQNKKVESFYFNSKDITSDDVVFVTENELSYSPAQKKSAVYDLLNTGLLGTSADIDVRTKTKLLDILGFGSVDNARDLNSLHIARAEGENIDLLNKKKCEVSYIDDHKLHIEEHTAFALSQNLLNDKDIKENVVQHICEHRAKLLERELINIKGEDNGTTKKI